MSRGSKDQPRALWVPPGAEMQPKSRVVEHDTSGPQLRLLRCTDCRSIDELPDFKGDPSHDVLLADLLMTQHVYESGTTHEVVLITVPEKVWRNATMQKRIVQQLSAGASKGLDELDGDYYATKSTYQEDALKCFSRHGRPKGADCIDYRAPDRRLGNPTHEGWKHGPQVYLCDFCPVQSQVNAKKMEQA